MASGKTSLMMQETQEMHVRSLGWEDPLEKGMATYCCLENLMGRGVWRATVCKGRTESDTTEAT